jgi:hypothetical protein
MIGTGCSGSRFFVPAGSPIIENSLIISKCGSIWHCKSGMVPQSCKFFKPVPSVSFPKRHLRLLYSPTEKSSRHVVEQENQQPALILLNSLLVQRGR